MRRLSPLLVAFVLLAGCASEGSVSPTTTAPTDTTPTTLPCAALADQQDVAYVPGGDALQRLDVYLPEGAGCDPVLSSFGCTAAAGRLATSGTR